MENNKKIINQMELKFKALSVNESFARASIAGFCLQINPSIDELTDIKTAVSEAVTNCVVHAYPNGNGDDDIYVCVKLFENATQIEIRDSGIGIKNLDEAKMPFYTTKPTTERSGMGFTVMESFMDKMVVENLLTGGLRVVLTKEIKQGNADKIKQIN